MASLENRGNGSWRVIISNGYNPDGSKRRLQRTIKVDPNKTENAQRREVEKQAAALETDFNRHLLTIEKKITVSALAKEYLSEQSRRLASATIKQYRDIIEGRIVPALGKIHVQDLTPRQISKFYSALEKEEPLTNRAKTGKLSSTYRLKYHTQLHAMLAYALRMGYISVNPADAVEPPRKDTGETQYYEPEECTKLLLALDSLPEQWRLFYYLALYTAARPGELIALDWSDISGNVLSIRAGSVRVPGGGTKRTDRPKTKSSIRQIILPPVIVRLLQEHRITQAEYRLQFGADWPEPNAVFTGALGHRMDISSPTQKFQKFLKANNLRPVPLYALRHTAASLMIAQGLSVRDVSARLGHSQTSTTLNIYSHAFADANARATDAITAALENARKEAK